MAIRPLTTLLAHKAIALASGLTESDRMVACAIVEHFNRETSQCDPGIDRLAGLTQFNRRTVIRATNRLHRRGLIRKRRHGGYLNRNSYEPAWERLTELLAEWEQQFRRKAGNRSTTHMSPAKRQGCHLQGDTDVTQTCITNLSQETYSKRTPEKRLEVEQVSRPSTASATAVRAAAERRWHDALLRKHRERPVTYAGFVEAIDDELREAATDAELKQPGSGLSYIEGRLKLSGIW
jgi:predicted transcriptional regulator